MSTERAESMTYQKQPKKSRHRLEIIDDNKYWWNAMVRAGLLTAATLLTLFTVIGTAGLAFFFVKQFGIDYAIPQSIVIPASFFVSSLIFSAYFSVFVLGMWNKTVSDCDESHPLEDSLHFDELGENLEIAEELNLNTRLKKAFQRIYNRQQRQEQRGKTTTKQNIAQFITGVFGITAVGFLAGGAYLGVMTVGITLSMTSVFFPLALTSAFCMFCSMTMYFWDDMMTNARKMSAPKAKQEKLWHEKLAKLPEGFSPEGLGLKARFWLGAYHVMAIFASIGFAAFKVYSSIHLAKMLGITSPIAIAVTGGIAFVSMTVMTGMTSGVRIWDSGLEHAAKADGHEIKNHLLPEHTTERTNPIRNAIAWTITFFGSAFNAVASYMGMATLNAFLLEIMLPIGAAALPAPLLAGLAGLSGFIAVCRFIDFWEFYGPRIAINLGGIEFVPTTEGVKIEKSERDLISKLANQQKESQNKNDNTNSPPSQSNTWTHSSGSSFFGPEKKQADTSSSLSADVQPGICAGN